MKTGHVVIVGAGLGGLAAALRLRAHGFDVTLLEKNDRVGGKLNLIDRDGYRFDTGPSLMTLPDVLADLFACVGERMEERLSFTPLEPLCRYDWPDGTHLDASSNLPLMVRELERVAPQDIAGFFRFLSYGADLYTATADAFLFNDFRDFGKLRKSITPHLLRQLPRMATTKTVADRVNEFFKSPHLRQLFNRFATYNGSSPYRAQATFCLISYVEFAIGGWYPKGGMYKIAESLDALAREKGVNLQTGVEVTEIVISDGKTRGVRLATGETIAADAVVANSDSLYTYSSLIGREHRKRFTDKKIGKIEPSCSGFIVLLGTRKKFDRLAHHNIFFSADYPKEFTDLFDRLRPADDPTIYVCSTSRTDPNTAPPGCENLFVMVNAPATTPDFDWDDISSDYRNLIVNKLEHFGLDGLNDSVEVEEIITPKGFTGWFNAWRGAIYGLSSNSLTSAFLRPPIRSRDAKGLYFAGGSTHPGGGIPLVLLSGKIAAELVASDLKQ